jgi:hypothetical protein
MIALLLISTLRFTIDVQRASATIPGDLNGNNMVDIFDAIILVKSYTVVRGSPSWNSNADINKDGVVDMLDALILAKYFGDSGSSNKPIVYANGTALYAPVTGQIVTFKGTQVDYEVLSGKHDSDKPGTLQQDYWFNYTDVKKLKSYGCNLVEFHDIVWKDMMPQKGIFDASWFATNSDRWVSWIRQEGMYCILSMSNFELMCLIGCWKSILNHGPRQQ